jgi:hypothetical protein
MRRLPVVMALAALALVTTIATPTQAGTEQAGTEQAGTQQAGTHPTKAKLVFSTPDFRWFSARDEGELTLSQVGDFWTQSFTVPGFRYPTQEELVLGYTSTLAPGKQMSVIIIVNGHIIGTLPIGPCCDAGFYSSSAAIGPSFNVLLLVDHGVGPTEGGVTLHVDGTSFLRMKL